MAQRNHVSLLELDIRDAGFSAQMDLWALRTICEMKEIVLATQDSITASRALMAEADRVLAADRR